jgi:hypothetical protein
MEEVWGRFDSALTLFEADMFLRIYIKQVYTDLHAQGAPFTAWQGQTMLLAAIFYNTATLSTPMATFMFLVHA